MKRRARRARTACLLALGYVALTCLFTYPLVLELGTHHVGEPRGDAKGYLWNYWWTKTALSRGTSPFETDAIFHPIGIGLAFHTLGFLQGVEFAPLSFVVGEVAAANLVVLWTFPASALAAYALARAEESVELAPRPVRIDALELTERPDPDHAMFLVRSGKGAYMRSLARDIAQALGSVGHVAELRRIAVGPFTEAQAISLETLKTLGHSLAASGQLMTVETALDDIPALALTEAEARRLRCGQSVGLIRRMDLERVAHLESGAVVCAMAEGKPVALARFEAGDLRPVRVLNL